MFDFIGAVGVVLIMAAYFMLQTERLTSKQLLYPVLNFIGALLITISIINDWNFSAFIMEVSWMLISGFGIWRNYTRNKREEKNE